MFGCRDVLPVAELWSFAFLFMVLQSGQRSARASGVSNPHQEECGSNQGRKNDLLKGLNSTTAASTENPMTKHLYFLKSPWECKLLSGDLNVTAPVMRDYDNSGIDTYMWHWENEMTLKNAATAARVRLEHITCTEANHPNPNTFPSGCLSAGGSALSVSTSRCSLILNTAAGSTESTEFLHQRWQLIPVENSDLAAVVCPFFIKINTTPCALLTGSDQGIVQARPFDENSTEKQLWYWSEGRLVHLSSGLVLGMDRDPKNQTTVALREEMDFRDLYQFWTMNANLIQPAANPDIFLDIYSNATNEGYVAHLSTEKNSNWSFVDAQNLSAVNSCVKINTEPLSCECCAYKHSQFDYYSKMQAWYIQAYFALY